ncbi:MAG: two-component regulator propeller domain-containing protein, partial [Flavobacterium sp.]
MNSKLIILFLFFISLHTLLGQNIKFEHYNENNGLSYNSVRHIVQDKNGFLWLGTFFGLNRFDGYQFKVYMSSELGKNKIFNDDITALELDANSNDLWIGTRKGLTRYQMDTNVFTTFFNKKKD